MSAESPSSKPVTPRRRRWWVRLLSWLGMLFLIVLLAAAGLAWWVWKNPQRAVAMVVEQLELPFKPETTAIQLEPGAVRLNDVVIRDVSTGQPWLKAAKVRWSATSSDLQRGQLGKLSIDELTADVDEPMARRLNDWLAVPATPSAGPSPVRGIERIELRDAHLKMAATEVWPAFEGRFDVQAERVNLEDATQLVVKRFKVVLHQARVDQHDLPVIESAGSLSKDGELRLEQLVLGQGHAAPSPWLLRQLTPAPATSTPSTGGTGPIKSVVLDRLELNDFSLGAGDPLLKRPTWWPPMTGRMSLKASDLALNEAGQARFGSVKLDVADVQWQPTSGDGRVAVSAGKVVLGPWQQGSPLHVIEAEFQSPVIRWTPSLEDSLMSEKATSGAGKASSVPVFIDRLALRSAAVSVQRTRRVPYEGRADIDLELAAVRVDDEGFHSVRAQRMDLANVSLAEHPAHREQALADFIKLDRATLRLVPDDWARASTIEELTLHRPVLVATDENVSWFKPKPPATVASASPSSPPAFHAKQLVVTEGSVDVAAQAGQRIELRSKIDITTEAGMQRVRLHQIRALVPERARLPVAGIEEIEAVVKLPDLWTSKRLQSLKVKGGELEVGDALLSLAGEETQSSPKASPVPAAPSTSPWRVSEVTISDTAITLQRVAPGLPPLKFNLDYTATDLPLDPSALVGNLVPQRIELSELSIKSPYDPLRNVAHLGSVFVDFTLDSLIQQRIDKVEIVAPTLFVGEDLFWYIDYYRKYAAGLPLPGAERMALASADKAFALDAATSAANAPVKEGGAWTVDTLKVDGGKLVIAPKGRPLPGIPRPFPFSFTTRMNQGKLEAEFDIPTDTYTWEQMKLQLEGMRGRVLFNLPIKNVDNNLTETFKVDRIRYKQLLMENAHLSVTYDANGIYGQFGGEAYEGYINGAFNVYMDTNFSWDGWISGAGVRTTEVTRVMCPAYFLLDGKVAATIVAQGNMNEVYQCDVKFSNASPGKFSIVALNDMLSDLPKDQATYEDDLMRIGVETLRDFEYDKVDAKCRFYGREGKGRLVLTGPAGSRKIDVNIYDHRWTTKPAKGSTVQVSNPAPP